MAELSLQALCQEPGPSLILNNMATMLVIKTVARMLFLI